MATEDKILVEKYLQGDEESFEILVQNYLKPIFNFTYRLSGSRQAAEDITQDTFIKAWKNLKRFNSKRKLVPYRTGSSGSGFKTWLFTIAKNTTFDYLKKKKEIPFSRFSDEERESWLENIADENILPDEILERKDISEELEAILQKLSPHYRAILLLHYKEDFTLHEISEILGEPYNTVKSRHQRGLSSLKNLLEKEKQD